MTVLVIRAQGTPDTDVAALRARGLRVEADPYLTVAPCDDDAARERAADVLEACGRPGGWLIVTSAAGVRALVTLCGAAAVHAAVTTARVAAVGPTSAAALAAVGAHDVVAPPSPTASGLLGLLRSVPASAAALPRSTIADPLLPDTLRARGWTLVERVVYRTEPVVRPPRTVPRVQAGDFAAIVLRSPSAARALVQHARVPAGTAIVAGGPTTALAARRLGLRVDAVSAQATADGVAHAVARVLGPA